MTKKKDNATQKLYKMFINIAKKTPNIFKTEHSIVMYDSEELFTMAYAYQTAREKNKKVEVYVPSGLSENDLTPGVKILDKFKYAAYVESDKVLHLCRINYLYDHEIMQNESLVLSDNFDDMKAHLFDILNSNKELYEIEDKNLLEELDPRIHVLLSVDNKEIMLGNDNHLSKFQAVNFETYLENMLENEELGK
ncbi:MAG: hypothetical protein IJS74_03930 [Clostridia bacterium]|nr:hypothetical protein [Clostridia bacterium]